jgi:hypothetical protein
MIELFNKTREQIQQDVSRVCSSNRAQTNKGPIKSTSGNLLIDSLMNIVERDGYTTTEDILNALKQKGMKHVTKEDLDNLSDPLLLRIGDTWFKREPSKTVYIYAPKQIKVIPGAIKEKDCVWNCPLTQSLVDFYREKGDQILILDTDIQRIFDVLYTPAEKMKKELLEELASLYD